MKKLVLALVLLSGCSGGGDADNGSRDAAPAQTAGGPGAAATGEETTLVGLYEGSGAGPVNQMCIVRRDGTDRFGLVVWGGNMHSCSGTGTVTRKGDTLRLAMTGDAACSIAARMDGETVTLPAAVPDGCAYYCGARASLANVAFTRKGRTAADAAKAQDLVGEPLCSGD